MGRPPPRAAGASRRRRPVHGGRRRVGDPPDHRGGVAPGGRLAAGDAVVLPDLRGDVPGASPVGGLRLPPALGARPGAVAGDADAAALLGPPHRLLRGGLALRVGAAPPGPAPSPHRARHQGQRHPLLRRVDPVRRGRPRDPGRRRLAGPGRGPPRRSLGLAAGRSRRPRGPVRRGPGHAPPPAVGAAAGGGRRGRRPPAPPGRRARAAGGPLGGGRACGAADFVAHPAGGPDRADAGPFPARPRSPLRRRRTRPVRAPRHRVGHGGQHPAHHGGPRPRSQPGPLPAVQVVAAAPLRGPAAAFAAEQTPGAVARRWSRSEIWPPSP